MYHNVIGYMVLCLLTVCSCATPRIDQEVGQRLHMKNASNVIQLKSTKSSSNVILRQYIISNTNRITPLILNCPGDNSSYYASWTFKDTNDDLHFLTYLDNVVEDYNFKHSRNGTNYLLRYNTIESTQAGLYNCSLSKPQESFFDQPQICMFHIIVLDTVPNCTTSLSQTEVHVRDTIVVTCTVIYQGWWPLVMTWRRSGTFDDVHATTIRPLPTVAVFQGTYTFNNLNTTQTFTATMSAAVPKSDVTAKPWQRQHSSYIYTWQSNTYDVVDKHVEKLVDKSEEKEKEYDPYAYSAYHGSGEESLFDIDLKQVGYDDTRGGGTPLFLIVGFSVLALVIAVVASIITMIHTKQRRDERQEERRRRRSYDDSMGTQMTGLDAQNNKNPALKYGYKKNKKRKNSKSKSKTKISEPYWDGDANSQYNYNSPGYYNDVIKLRKGDVENGDPSFYKHDDQTASTSDSKPFPKLKDIAFAIHEAKHDAKKLKAHIEALKEAAGDLETAVNHVDEIKTKKGLCSTIKSSRSKEACEVHCPVHNAPSDKKESPAAVQGSASKEKRECKGTCSKAKKQVPKCKEEFCQAKSSLKLMQSKSKEKQKTLAVQGSKSKDSNSRRSSTKSLRNDMSYDDRAVREMHPYEIRNKKRRESRGKK